MTTIQQRLAFNLSHTFILIVAAVYLFLETAIVPYWHDLSGVDLQAWFAGPFQRFAIMMVPVHLLSILTTVIALILLRKSPHLRLMSLACITLLICQGFNFTLFATELNPALQSGMLSDNEAKLVLQSWSLWHDVRTAAVVVSALTMIVIAVTQISGDQDTK